jgi:hypothetical protein
MARKSSRRSSRVQRRGGNRGPIIIGVIIVVCVLGFLVYRANFAPSSEPEAGETREKEKKKKKSKKGNKAKKDEAGDEGEDGPGGDGGAPPPKEGFRRYEHKLFSVDFPQGWESELDEDGDLMLTSSVDGEDDSFREFCLVQADDEEIPLAFLMVAALSGLKGEVENFKKLETGMDEIHGAKVQWALCSSQEDSVNYKYLVYALKKGKKHVVFMASSELFGYLKYGPLFKEVISTIRIK